MRYIDLFAGIGGMRLGLEQALGDNSINGRCVFTSEIDRYACETYYANFNEEPKGDISKTWKEIPDFDFLLAGFPCQAFSYAGKKRGFGDTRGTLFFEVEKILRAYKPRGFLLENVRGLTSHDQGKTFQTILKSLHYLGYKTNHLILNSSVFGVPQNRVRIYILGLRGCDVKMSLFSDLGAADSHKYKDTFQTIDLFSRGHNKFKVKDILEANVDSKYSCSNQFTHLLSKAIKGDFEKLHGKRLIDFRGGNSLHSWELGIKGECTDEEIEFMNHLIAHRRKKSFGNHQDGKMLTLEQIRTFYDHPDIMSIINSLIQKGYLKELNGKYNPVCGNMSFEVFKFLDPESISITLTSSDAHRLGIVQNGKPRRITPRECARLQGFPETYKLHPNDKIAYKQIGNSVTVPVIREVLSDLILHNPSLHKKYSSETDKLTTLA